MFFSIFSAIPTVVVVSTPPVLLLVKKRFLVIGELFLEASGEWIIIMKLLTYVHPPMLENRCTCLHIISAHFLQNIFLLLLMKSQKRQRSHCYAKSSSGFEIQYRNFHKNANIWLCTASCEWTSRLSTVHSALDTTVLLSQAKSGNFSQLCLCSWLEFFCQYWNQFCLMGMDW